MRLRRHAATATAISLFATACLSMLLAFGVPRDSLDARSSFSRKPAQFTDVGNVVLTGYGGFPNAIYRDWWLPLYPTSCFSVGLKEPIWLAQCVAFTTSF